MTGKAEPYSLTGSLPLVHEMQGEGFDIQLIGRGLHSSTSQLNLGRF
jgi:acetylornithine deacetylase